MQLLNTCSNCKAPLIYKSKLTNGVYCLRCNFWNEVITSCESSCISCYRSSSAKITKKANSSCKQMPDLVQIGKQTNLFDFFSGKLKNIIKSFEL